MTPENLERIFERFAQFSSSTQKRKIGTGLGLSITKEIVEKSNGAISAYSSLGRGTEFVLCLPTEYCPSYLEPSEKKKEALEKLKEKKLRILGITNQKN
mmetsp:Transcript_25635/g.22649  ORF Transcript_25635/g.22649 Transcript_25635/m.22649 type:complete len:99 (-) Transcript_25635:545-841(-)